MSKKINRYFINHPLKCIVSFLIVVLIYAFIISKLPEIVVTIIMGFLLVLMIATIILLSLRDVIEKQKFQNMTEEDYEEEWKQYVDFVNETIKEESYERNKLSTNWIKKFNQIVYTVATNQYLLRRKLNDFDIAACLIYSLTGEKNTDENILFAFNCAKKVISEPKEYFRVVKMSYNFELLEEKKFQKVNISIPDETITTEALISIIRTYLMQETEDGIVQLSDFLHILYLKCQ